MRVAPMKSIHAGKSDLLRSATISRVLARFGGSDAHQWLSFYERFWTERLDVLEQFLRKEDQR